MLSLISELSSWLARRFRGRADLELEVIAFRHQLAVLRRQRPSRSGLSSVDRFIWVRLYRVWPRCLEVTVLVKPATERVIGSIRRECLDHVVVFNERHLRRVLSSYLEYYQRSRTHLSLGKDCPNPRAIEPPAHGRVIALPQVGASIRLKFGSLISPPVCSSQRTVYLTLPSDSRLNDMACHADRIFGNHSVHVGEHLALTPGSLLRYFASTRFYENRMRRKPTIPSASSRY